MIPLLIFGLLVSSVLASPPQPAPTTGGILTPPRLRFTPPTTRRRRASPLQVLLRSSSRKSSHSYRDNVQSIDSEFINSRAIQFAGAKKTTTRPSPEEVTSANGSGFWPPWPFNHLKSSGSSADGAKAGQDSGGGLDYKKDAMLFWRYISHRARVGARQIQQRES